MFDEELREVFVVLQTFLQLSYKEADGQKRRRSVSSECSECSLHPTPLTLDLLSVPVVDLVDVPKHDLVFSLHVIGDALLLDSLHEALHCVAQGQWREQRRNHIIKNPAGQIRNHEDNTAVDVSPPPRCPGL